MTPDEIIEGILEREGEGTPPYLALNDDGGRTSWGISERAHPEAWVNGPPKRDAAKLIYQTVYARPFDVLRPLNDQVRACLIDDAVMRGVPEVVQTLQSVVGVKPDGVIGPMTKGAVIASQQMPLLRALVQARVIALIRIVEAKPKNLSNLRGWVHRAMVFLP